MTLRMAIALLALLFASAAARAEHFEIQLTVTSPSMTEKNMAFADTNTAERQQGLKPRPVCHAKVGEELTLQLFFTSNFPHDSIKQCKVIYFIAPQAKAGQDAVPPRDTAIIQGQFIMDFKPKTGKVGLRQRMKIDKAGTYLVRVESENSASDHEHFAALDLVIE